jgi:hypothetical protein
MMPFYDYIPKRMRDRPITALAYLLFVITIFSFLILAFIYGTVRILGIEVIDDLIRRIFDMVPSDRVEKK